MVVASQEGPLFQPRTFFESLFVYHWQWCTNMSQLTFQWAEKQVRIVQCVQNNITEVTIEWRRNNLMPEKGSGMGRIQNGFHQKDHIQTYHETRVLFYFYMFIYLVFTQEKVILGGGNYICTCQAFLVEGLHVLSLKIVPPVSTPLSASLTFVYPFG